MIKFYGLDRQYKTLKDELLDATDKVLSSGQFIAGEYTSDFEFWLAQRTGCQYAITVDSGTQALAMIAQAFKDLWKTPIISTIRVPNLTYVATMNAFLTTGGYDVELADCDSNGIMLEDVKTPSCIVGLYGRQIPYETDREYDIVDGAQHWLVADGNIGRAMAISFDPTKNLPSTGNGGAIVTNDTYLYAYLYQYKNNGKVKHNLSMLYDQGMYDRISGTNSKMSELECAHLLVRTRYLDSWQLRRKQIRKYYIERFKEYPVTCLSASTEEHCDHKFVITVTDREKFCYDLHGHGIETKVHYESVLSELPIAKKHCRTLDFLSCSTMLSRSVVSLPIYPELTDSEVEYIADKVIEIISKV